MINADTLIAKLMCFVFTQKCFLLPSPLAQHAFKLCLVKFSDARCRMGVGSVSETYVNPVPARNCLVRVDPKILFPKTSNRDMRDGIWSQQILNIYTVAVSVLRSYLHFFSVNAEKRVFLGPINVSSKLQQSTCLIKWVVPKKLLFSIIDCNRSRVSGELKCKGLGQVTKISPEAVYLGVHPWQRNLCNLTVSFLHFALMWCDAHSFFNQ